MAGFDELQALWQGQPRPAVPAAEIAELRRGLREYARRVNRIYVVKAAALPVLIGSILALGNPSRTVLAAVAALAVVAATLVAFDWHRQRAIGRLDFTSVSVAFVRQTIQRLEGQRDFLRHHYWLLLGALVLFENAWFGSMPGPWSVQQRIGWHLFATGLPVIALEGGRAVRRWRFNRECRPLIERLRAIEESLREEPS
jgi:hypothetical protein